MTEPIETLLVEMERQHREFGELIGQFRELCAQQLARSRSNPVHDHDAAGILTPQQAAHQTGLSDAHVRKLCEDDFRENKGKGFCFKRGGRWGISRDRFLASRMSFRRVSRA